MRRADPDPKAASHIYVLSMFKPPQAWRNISKAVYGVINTHSQFETFFMCNTGCEETPFVPDVVP